jgi:hypothetical protein
MTARLARHRRDQGSARRFAAEIQLADAMATARHSDRGGRDASILAALDTVWNAFGVAYASAAFESPQGAFQ